ncbi:MAG: hypothetical protein EOS81_04235 [Mesorhizobium sp.]|uniref:hypothetical protein n=1 Tax=Mesorhizobium sp. TaxID=1871066 RepID=UPI000FE4D48F|nr:MAG: hypothetical protein EOS81_04235 [Mesorhizobium sp.]
MLHPYFHPKHTGDGYPLIGEHNLMLEAVRAKDIELADEQAISIRGGSSIILSGSCPKATIHISLVSHVAAE